MQGGFGAGPEPDHMPIRSACNLVMGEIPGGVLTGDGTLLNRDTFAWAPWSPAVGNNEDSLAMLRSTAALRRGRGRDYLVYGRMQRPAQVTGVRIVHWESNSQVHKIPAVFHSAWQSPQGRFGIVLANWTDEKQAVSIVDARLGNQIAMCVSGREISTGTSQVKRGAIAVSLPPLTCALLEGDVKYL
jgi:hypothetical protein